jgi:hypothetical protein
MKKLLLTSIAVLFLATGIVRSQSLSDVMNTIAFTAFATAFAVIAVLLWPKTIAYRERTGVAEERIRTSNSTFSDIAFDLLFTLLWGGLLPGAVILGFWITK